MEQSIIEAFRQLFGEPWAQQLAIWTTSLAVASYIHSGRVEAGIERALGKLTAEMKTELKLLGATLSKNLQEHSAEITAIKERQTVDDRRNQAQDERLSRMEQTLVELQALVKADIVVHGGPSPT